MKRLLILFICIMCLSLYGVEKNYEESNRIKKQSPFFKTAIIGGHVVVDLALTRQINSVVDFQYNYLTSNMSVNLFLDAFCGEYIGWSNSFSNQGLHYLFIDETNEFQKKQLGAIYKNVLEHYKNYTYCISNENSMFQDEVFKEVSYNFGNESYTIDGISFTWLATETDLELYQANGLSKYKAVRDFIFKKPWQLKVKESIASKMKKGQIRWNLVFRIVDILTKKNKKGEIVLRQIIIEPIAWKFEQHSCENDTRNVLLKYNWNDEEIDNQISDVSDYSESQGYIKNRCDIYHHGIDSKESLEEMDEDDD